MLNELQESPSRHQICEQINKPLTVRNALLMLKLSQSVPLFPCVSFSSSLYLFLFLRLPSSLRVTLDPSKRQSAVKSGPAAPSVPPTLTVPSNPAAKTLSKSALHSFTVFLFLYHPPLLQPPPFPPHYGVPTAMENMEILKMFFRTGNVNIIFYYKWIYLQGVI